MIADASCPNQSPYATSHTWKPGALSPVTANFLKYVPSLTATGTPPPFAIPDNFDLAEITARADQELGAKDKLTERYFSDAFILQGVENLTNLLSLNDEATNHYYNSLINETHTFNDHIVNTSSSAIKSRTTSAGRPATDRCSGSGCRLGQFLQPDAEADYQIYVEGGTSKSPPSRRQQTP